MISGATIDPEAGDEAIDTGDPDEVATVAHRAKHQVGANWTTAAVATSSARQGPSASSTRTSIGYVASTSSSPHDLVHQQPVSKLRTRVLRCRRCIQLGFYTLSSMLVPIIFATQMVYLDHLFLNNPFHDNPIVVYVVFFPVEILLLLHMLRHFCKMLLFSPAPAQTVRAGSLHWTIYCWLICPKCAIVFFYQVKVSYGLWMSPIFYCVLSFKALRHFLSGSDGRGSVSRRRAAMDVVLLQDMVWHVVMDMIDINYMMWMSETESGANGLVDEAMLQNFPEGVEKARIATGVFIALALFFHGQSFPAWVSVGRPRATGVQGGRAGVDSKDDAAERREAKDSGCDVIKARKRSAIVSILLVDLPFLMIRTYLWSLSISSPTLDAAAVEASTAAPSPAPSLAGAVLPAYALGQVMSADQGTLAMEYLASMSPQQSHLDKLWVKNILCLLLQSMQLRFVQLADLERSAKLSWWGGNSTGGQRGAKERHKKHLKEWKLGSLWAKLNLEEEERLQQGESQQEERQQPEDGQEAAAACADGPEAATLSSTTAVSRGIAVEPNRTISSFASSRTSTTVVQADESAETGPESVVSRRRIKYSFCCCRCGRKSHSRGGEKYCSCFSFDCSHAVLLHGMIGFMLGWLLAKVDFSQCFMLLAGTHLESYGEDLP